MFPSNKKIPLLTSLLLLSLTFFPLPDSLVFIAMCSYTDTFIYITTKWILFTTFNMILWMNVIWITHGNVLYTFMLILFPTHISHFYLYSPRFLCWSIHIQFQITLTFSPISPSVITLTWQLSYILPAPSSWLKKKVCNLDDQAHFILMATDPKWALNIDRSSQHSLLIKSPLHFPTFLIYIIYTHLLILSNHYSLKSCPYEPFWYPGFYYSLYSQRFYSYNYCLYHQSINS